ncbi:zinc finger protein 582-like isoform X1 [Vombatus ursinus]|uniref:zinc finger protein 582-like isoform X1 n=1 Tax=Vombatus ursinus TaxID=29139 RepID=UPI000FFD435C|nr:zinc finger protein 582-like isoform X1 [Vombatus ursinus]
MPAPAGGEDPGFRSRVLFVPGPSRLDLCLEASRSPVLLSGDVRKCQPSSCFLSPPQPPSESCCFLQGYDDRDSQRPGLSVDKPDVLFYLERGDTPWIIEQQVPRSTCPVCLKPGTRCETMEAIPRQGISVGKSSKEQLKKPGICNSKFGKGWECDIRLEYQDSSHKKQSQQVTITHRNISTKFEPINITDLE